jgi:CubicO group peptidase (beta-lactamase class C family)
VFESGAGGLLSTVDDFLTFARLLLGGGTHRGRQLLPADAVASLTTNHLAPDQIATAGMLLQPNGWGYGMAVSVEPDEVSPEPGRYGWAGSYGTVWFNDPHRELIALAFTQTSDFLFNGGSVEFSTWLPGRPTDRTGASASDPASCPVTYVVTTLGRAHLWGAQSWSGNGQCGEQRCSPGMLPTSVRLSPRDQLAGR